MLTKPTSFSLDFFKIISILILTIVLSIENGKAQCGANTPTFIVDLSSAADSAWISPDTLRNDTCCGATNPDKCVAFELTLSDDAQGILFDVCDGALPPGALFYQVGCGPQTAVGNVLCLNGAGPHYITFCKPGNNNNKYCITSIPEPSAGPDLAVNDGCIDTLSAVGFSDTSITWTSVFPGPTGAYDTLLNCTQDCDTVIINGGNNYPTFIDYQVCGYPIGSCGVNLICDTTRVYFYNTLEVEISPINPTVCFGQSNTWIKANPNGGSPPYKYSWSTGETTDSIQVGVGTYIIELSDTSGCPPTYDTITVTEFLNPITANAGQDQTVCIQNLPVNLNGNVIAANGGKWSGGNGSFSPSDTILSTSYTPTAAEITSGNISLILTTTGNGSCPPDSDTININIVDFNASLNPTATNVSCYGGNDGSATISVNGGNSPFTYQWDMNTGSQTGSTATNLDTGTYVVTVTNSYGCIDSTSININEPAPLIASITSSTNVSCNGGNDGQATASAQGGTAPYTYAWPSNGNNVTENNLSAGSFIVTVTDNNGCSDTALVNITEPVSLIASIANSTNVSCNAGSDGQATASALGGTAPYTYAWPSSGNTATENNLSAGSFIVTVTDNNGCSDTALVNITEPAPLIASITSSTNVSCNGGSDGKATASALGGTTPYTYAWPSSGNTATENNLSAGSFIVTVTDNNGCADTALVNITEPAPLIASIANLTNVSCNGGNDGQATASALGGTAPYTYAWPSNGNNTTENNLSAGSFIVTVTDNNGCSDTALVNITEPATLIASIANSTNVSCNAGSDGQATASAQGGTAPYTYAWPSSGNTATENNLSAGSFIVTVTDNNGCSDTALVNITEPVPLIASITSSTNVSCNAGNDGQATASAQGGTAPYTYAWPSSGNNATENNLSAGSFIVTVTDNNGCADTALVNITEPVSLIASIANSTNVSCNAGSDGQATASAQGGTAPYTYAWPSSGNNTTENNLSAGSFIVTVTDNNGCSDTALVNITEPATLIASITSSTNVSCNGGSDGQATASAQGGTAPYTYAWPSNGNNTTENNLSAGSFIVTVTDNNGCSDTALVNITEPATLIASIANSTNVSCNAGSDGQATASAQGGTAPYTYAWPSSGNTATENNLSAGSFIVTVTDNNGCSDTALVNITEPAPLIASIENLTNVSCNGGNDGQATASALGGTAPYTYAWPSNGNNTTENNLSAGSFIVTVTDNNGCSDTALVNITEPAPLIASIANSTNVSCNAGSDGQATASAQGGTAPYTYAWPSNGNNAFAPNLAAGSYETTVTDFNGCTATTAVVINEPTSLNISAVINDVSCHSLNDGNISAMASGGTAPYDYRWSNGSRDTNIALLTPSTYSLTITDANGCQIDSTFEIIEPQPLVLSTTANDTICLGNSFTISAVASGGNNGYTYNWNNGLGFGASKSVSPLETTTYQVTVNDSKGCLVGPESITIYVRDLNSDFLEATKGGDICLGESTTVSATHNGNLGPYTYNWNTLGSGLGPFTVSPQNSTEYIINVTDRCGTTIQDTIEVLVHPYPSINLPDTIASGCSPLEVTFQDSINRNNQNLRYSWEFGNGESAEVSPITYTYQNPGTYRVSLTIMNQFGCENKSSSGGWISVTPSPVANFTADPPITNIDNPEILFSNTSIGESFWYWNFGVSRDTNINQIEITFPDTGSYPVQLNVINSFGCRDSIRKEIRINPVYDLIIPNAFTPNLNGSNGGLYNSSDQNNDVFFVFADYVRDFHMMIFNRWGELIFESFDINKGWDGYYRDRLCQQDVYVYKVEITWTDGSNTVKAGDITLFR